MKNLWLPLILGAVGSVLLLKHVRKSTPMLQYVPTSTEDPSAKNFGAFPIEIPEKQFDDFFI